MKFLAALADVPSFKTREFIAGKDTVTLARDILALDQEACSAAFRKSPMKRAKLRGLKRNAAVALGNLDTTVSSDALIRAVGDADLLLHEAAKSSVARLADDTEQP